MMRREKREKLKSWGAFPLFWKGCECCELECRFEWVWKFTKIRTMYMPPIITTHMICRGCAETRRDADDFAVAYTKIRNNDFPPMPPVKPPKTSAEKEMENFNNYLRGTGVPEKPTPPPPPKK